jgi:hypothetical protein
MPSLEGVGGTGGGGIDAGIEKLKTFMEEAQAERIDTSCKMIEAGKEATSMKEVRPTS